MEDNYNINLNGHNPFLITNMKCGLNRLIKAVNEREKIVVYGYYDFDAICAMSIFMLVLKYLNSDVEYFIPSEYREFHNRSLNIMDIENHIKYLGTNLIIALGCSITEEELRICAKNGIDVIVIDNQVIGVQSANCIIINPKQEGCAYCYKSLTVSSLTYKMIEVLSSYYKMKCKDKYLDLVMIGILTSGCPIDGENRYFVEEGFKRLQKTNNYGLIALREEYKNNYKDVEFYEEGINLLPYMISNQKLDNAKIMVELLTTNNSYRATQIAKYLYIELAKNIEGQ